MYRKIFGTLAYGISLFGILFFTSCNNENEEEFETIQKKNIIENIIVPQDGFIFTIEGKEFTEVLFGTNFNDFVETRRYKNNTLISTDNILYTFENDLDYITIVSAGSDSLVVKVFEETFIIDSIRQIAPNRVAYKVTDGSSAATHAEVYRNGLTVRTFTQDLASMKLIPNPFVSNAKVAEPTDFNTIVAAINLVVTIVRFIKDWIDESCNKKLNTDKYNCERTSDTKCVKQISRCHYECIPCPN